MTESVRGWLLPVGAAVLIVALVAVALVREPVELDPNTSEGTVQVYLQALSDGDYASAFAVLDPDFYEGCDASSLAAYRQDHFTAYRQDHFTAGIEDGGNPVEGDTAFVGVSMTFGDGGPLGSQWTLNQSFTLVKHDGSWWITGEDVWPYFAFDCLHGVES